MADILERHGYDTPVILTALEILSKLRDSSQLIEILPEEDITNDPICQKCQKKRQTYLCDEPLKPEWVGKDGFEALQIGLKIGEHLNAQQLLAKKEAFGPHFRI